MKERIGCLPVKQKIFTTLLCTFIYFSCFNNSVQAQGWGFTFEITHSGPCGTSIPIIPSFTVPPAFPTKSQCEGLRQTILAIRVSSPAYDNRGNYIGDCAVFYTCTPCTGSDIVIQGQVSPGEISLDGQFVGKPLFTTHESAAFEDWATDYKQQLAAYGITSILGNTLTPPKIPLTGDKSFDDFYNSQMANFNPKTPAAKPAHKEASVAVVSDKPEDSPKTIPLMGGSPLTAEERERQKFGPTYIDQANMFKNTPDGEINKNGDDHPLIDLSREIGVTAAGWLPGTAGYIGIAAVNIISEDAKSIKDIWDGKSCPTTETMLNNAFENTKKDYKEKVIGDVKEEGVSNLSEKAYGKDLGGTVTKTFKYYNYAKDVNGIYNKIKDYNWKYGSKNDGN